MTRKERLLNTLQGKAVDRPPVSFYEVDWYVDRGEDPDPYNIFHHPSWRPLLELTRDKVDRILSINPVGAMPKRTVPDRMKTVVEENGDERITTFTLEAAGRKLTSRTTRQKDVFTVWTTEHLLKDADDFKAYLSLPPEEFAGTLDVQAFLEAEEKLGDGGISLINSSDPLCMVAPLFDMGTYTVMALTEEDLFTEALERAARYIFTWTRAVAEALPGRLWRICGPEYAGEPYLPPSLFHKYVTPYVREIVDIIHAGGGFARVHCHGRIRNIMPYIMETGCDGIDPIEPPGQGDVTMEYMRRNYGDKLVLFGNLEITDIENLPAEELRKKVMTALDEGTAGSGRGMVLMPSACPYGRVLPEKTLKNYELILECVENYR